MSFHAKIWYCFIALGSISGTYGMDCKYGKDCKEKLVIELFTKLESIQFKAIKESRRRAKGVEASMLQRRELRDVLQRAHVKADVIPLRIKETVREKNKDPLRSNICDMCMGNRRIKKDNKKEISYSVYQLLGHLHNYANNEKRKEWKLERKALNYGVTYEYLNALDAALTIHIKGKEKELSRSEKKTFKKTCEELLGPYAIKRKKDKPAPLIVIQPVESGRESEAPLEQKTETSLIEAISPSPTQKGSPFQKIPFFLGVIVPLGFLAKKIMPNKKKRKALPSRKKGNEDPIIK